MCSISDENTKLNKLLYFTYLMYYAVTGTDLTNDKFEKWDNGPVSREIYREYKSNLEISDEKVSVLEKMEFQNEPMFMENIDGELVFS